MNVVGATFLHVACARVTAVRVGLAERDPVADLRGALPPTKPVHFASIKDPVKVGELMRAIAGYDAKAEAVRAALRLAPYVFVRPTELRKADWSEFNLGSAEWRLPPERTKMGFPHIVPLSRQAIQILRELFVITGPKGLVFPSIRTGARAISNNTINAALRKLGYTREEMTGHGFRSMASTILNEQGWHPDAIERQLAHIEQNDVRAREAFMHCCCYPRGSRHKYHSRSFTMQLDADIGGAFGIEIGGFALQIKRKFTGHHKQRCLNSAGQQKPLSWIDGMARH